MTTPTTAAFLSPRLPPELISEIIAQIIEPQSLSALALLSTGFLPFVQKAFFRHVTLDFVPTFKFRNRLLGQERDPARRSPERLLDLLTRSPHLAGYIKCLTLNVGEVSTTSLEDSQITVILGLLPNLVKIAFPVLDEGLQTLNRYQVQVESNGARVGGLPYLSYLTPKQEKGVVELDLRIMSNANRGTDLQLAFLHLYPALKRVTLGPLSPDQGWAVRPRHSAARELEFLSFDGLVEERYDYTIQWLKDPFCMFSVARLRVLEIKVAARGVGYGSIEELMSLCDSVEEFSLIAVPEAHNTYHITSGRQKSEYDTAFSPPSLKCLPKLRILTVHGDIAPVKPLPGRGRRTFRHPISWISDLLKTQETSPIESFTMVYKVPVSLACEKLELIQWDELVETVSCSKLFPVLGKVALKVEGTVPMPKMWTDSMLETLRDNEVLSGITHGLVLLPQN